MKTTRRTKTSLAFSWGASRDRAGVTAYRVYEYLAGRWTLIGTTTSKTRSLTRYGLRHKTRHRFAVRAYEAAGKLSAPAIGAWSTAK